MRGGLPGEVVDGPIIESKKDWARIAVGQVHERSPQRVTPPCPQRLAGCGSCDWQHIEASAQLPAKMEIVADALARTARLPDAEVRVGQAVPPLGYRTTLRLIGDEQGRPSYRRERSHETVPGVGCLVAHPGLKQLIEAVELSPGLELSLRISNASGAVTALWDPRKGDVSGLPTGVGTGPKSHISEVISGVELRVSAASFFQSGPAAAELLVDSVRRAAPELENASLVVDAYSGVGLFSCTVAQSATRVIAIERSRSSSADCVHNLGERDSEVHRIDVAKWQPPTELSADVVIADPSRSGLGPGAAKSLVAAGAPVIVLVSCDPVSLARDTSILGGHGFRHASTEVLDVFPHTHHVECVTRFERA